MSDTKQAWLYVRGRESVRVEIDGTSVGVYGPGERSSQSRFGEAIEATLHQAAVEQALVLDGWTLEQMTTERRAAGRAVPLERRRDGRALRLVPRDRIR